jgi:3-oxoacyl-(acyl-carrier-protein) synthase
MDFMPPRIVITGIGCVTSLGSDAEQTFEALLQGQKGFGPLTLFPSPRYSHVPVGEITYPLPRIPGARASRTERLAYAAASEALCTAGYDPEELPEGKRWACLAGTTVAGMLSTENYFAALWSGGRKPPALWLKHHPAGSVSETLAHVLGIEGLTFTISTACASGLHTLILGRDLIRSGMASRVLAVGADSLSRITVNGFGSLLIVDPEGAKPFDQNRKGLTLGEAAGALVLETEAAAQARGARIWAYVDGCGNTCDAYHPSAPDPEGRGAQAAMRQALEQAGLLPEAVGYVNAHGTGTPDNDRAESLALARVFPGSRPLVSSTKGAMGHTLGAAGAVESVICVQALNEGRLPPTTGCQTGDSSLPLAPLMKTVSVPIQYAMNNSFGFGGNNASVVFGKA